MIGTLISRSSIRKLLKCKYVRGVTELVRANQIKDLGLYFFSIKGVDLKKKIIQGIYFDKQNRLWQKDYFPYPDIIYKRCQTRKKYRSLANTFEEQLRAENVLTLNYLLGFNKWEVLEHLKTYPELTPYLPETYLYKEPQDLFAILEQKKTVYLKACRGGRGRQVICISKLPQGGYEYNYFINGLNNVKVDDFDTLLTNILEFYQNRPFIIQEAIDLIKIDNSLVDLRPEVQRNRDEIEVIALPVRIGRTYSPITTHADSYRFEDFFKNYLDYSDEKIKDLKMKVTDFVKNIYSCIEDYYGPCGELGIDIGLDNKEHLWFIECNSRSRKVSLFNAYDEITINNSYLNLLDYASYLYENRRKT